MIEADEGLVRSLLADQHPDLAGLPLRLAGVGWDNVLWRLSDDLLVRLPRRPLAAPLAANEQRWLPELAPRLPLPVPVPVRIGGPGDGFPWPWSVVPWFEGTPGDRAPIDNHPEESGRRLGAFLRALHQEAPPDAPRNPFRDVPLAQRRADWMERDLDATGSRRIWERALEAEPWAGPPVLIHADLHPANVVVRDGRLAAVIDFGDMCAGDPATDVAAAWMLLPAEARPAFAEAYGGVDETLERRALGWALHFALLLIRIAADNRPTYEAVGRRTLDAVLTTPPRR